MRNRFIFYITCVILMFSLSGCGGINQILEDQMVNQSGLLEDQQYQTYQKYADEGKLDNDGYYKDSAEEPLETHAPIHVTFAENNNLKIQYFADADHREILDQTACYMNPGDTIYAHVDIKGDDISTMYEFAGFRVVDISEEGKRTEDTAIKAEGEEPDYVLMIPDGFEGKEVSVEPLGKYQNRAVSLKDYYVDDNGNEIDLDGTWFINEKECHDNSVEISPVSSYVISYKYDSSEYFYLSSTPESFYSNNSDGIIIFNQRNADDETADYEVVLHKYIPVSLVSDSDRTVKVNGDTTEQSVKANNELQLGKHQYGDKITIETNKEWSELERNRELILINTETLSGGKYKYTLIVPEADGQFLFNPEDYNYAHGTIAFKCFGQTVNSPKLLAKGSIIYYEQKTAENGYWLAGDNHNVVVTDEAETVRKLKEIHFTPMSKVSVSLPQPEFGGIVQYKLNGNRVFGTSCNTYSGSVITMKLIPWEGWIVESAEEITYKVDERKTQIAMAGNSTVDSLFWEDEDHKPKLKVTLEKSVGENMEFTLTASGYAVEAVKYGGGWKVTDILPNSKNTQTYNIIDNSQIIVNNQKIGTEKPIEIKMTNKAVQSGKAVKQVIEKKDSKKNKTEEIRYIDDLSVPTKPIDIYSPDEMGKSKVWYESVDITIGVVDVETFAPTPAVKHSSIVVKNADTNITLMKGDLIEGSQKVTVTIKPETGYYVAGKKVGDGFYQDTMKFSDYQKNINNIITSHTILPYYVVTLDTSDKFAKYTYKLDGKEVSGTINTKEGQKLELTYEIIDPDYELSRAAGGFVFGIGASKTKVTKAINIDSSLQGKTITKESFGIETVRKGGQ